jgi:hypothetical protein
VVLHCLLFLTACLARVRPGASLLLPGIDANAVLNEQVKKSAVSVAMPCIIKYLDFIGISIGL